MKVVENGKKWPKKWEKCEKSEKSENILPGVVFFSFGPKWAARSAENALLTKISLQTQRKIGDVARGAARQNAPNIGHQNAQLLVKFEVQLAASKAGKAAVQARREHANQPK